jgi:hypothetical protein
VKIAVVSPHRGDAALAVGLALEEWLRQGHSVEVISCFTRSEQVLYSDADSVHPNDRMSFVSALRKREEEAWVKLYRDLAKGGRLTVTDLNMKDAPKRLRKSVAEVVGLDVDPAAKELLKIRRAVERSEASALVLPLALYRHIDRVMAREAAMPFVAIPMALYEDQPQATTQDAEATAAAVRRLEEELGIPLEAAFAGPAALSPQELEAAVARKRRMALCFDSQMGDAIVEDVARFCLRYEGRERLWTNSAWRGDALLSLC